MSKLITRVLSLLLALILFAAPAAAIPENGGEQLVLLIEIASNIHNYALYPPEDLSLDGVTAGTLKDDPDLFMTLVESWLAPDPYGRFMSREDYDVAFDAGPPLYGIGIQVDMSMPLGVYVEAFLPGGGAGLSGMEVGALIVSVDGEDIVDRPYLEVRPLFLGEWWTTVDVGYINPGSVEVLTETIQRGALSVDNVQGFMIDGTDIGYISISRFGSIADYFDFDHYYHEYLPEMGAKSVIIDLRGNPGGQVDTLYYILNVMLPDEGVLLLEYVDAEGVEPVYSSGWDLDELADSGLIFWQPDDIIVLVNSESASASEVFAGALQVHGLAVIVGETTVGKAHSQYHIPLSTDDVLIVTGNRIDLYEVGTYQGVGIIPDHEVAQGTLTGAELVSHPLDTSRALFRQSVLTERIAAVQERLSLLGYYRAEPNGVFDDYMMWCLNRYQAANKLPPARFVNAETLKMIDKAAMERKFVADTQMDFALELLGASY
ncbi:MAG: S41 family peptidase [Oscillospiraceae bacterium]|nr:S41 family peptidase [Oscillospiraceae bacterium]